MARPKATTDDQAFAAGVGARLNALRTEKGLTQAAFAQQCGLEFSTVRKWLGPNPSTVPTAKHVAKIAGQFDVPTDRILLGDDDRNAPLATQVGRHVSDRVFAELDVGNFESVLRDLLHGAKGGEQMLEYLVGVAIKDVRRNEAWLRTKSAVGAELSRLASTDFPEFEGLVEILNRFFSAPAPDGEIIRWENATFRQPKRRTSR